MPIRKITKKIKKRKKSNVPNIPPPTSHSPLTPLLNYIQTNNPLSLHSPPLHQKQIQRRIPQHRKHSTHNSQTRNISPKSQHIETETAQNGTAGNFNIEAVLLVDER